MYIKWRIKDWNLLTLQERVAHITNMKHTYYKNSTKFQKVNKDGPKMRKRESTTYYKLTLQDPVFESVLKFEGRWSKYWTQRRR